MPDPVIKGYEIIGLYDNFPFQVRFPAAKQWVEISNDMINPVCSPWRVEGEDPLDTVNIKIADGIYIMLVSWPKMPA